MEPAGYLRDENCGHSASLRRARPSPENCRRIKKTSGKSGKNSFLRHVFLLKAPPLAPRDVIPVTPRCNLGTHIVYQAASSVRSGPIREVFEWNLTVLLSQLSHVFLCAATPLYTLKQEACAARFSAAPPPVSTAGAGLAPGWPGGAGLR